MSFTALVDSTSVSESISSELQKLVLTASVLKESDECDSFYFLSKHFFEEDGSIYTLYIDVEGEATPNIREAAFFKCSDICYWFGELANITGQFDICEICGQFMGS